MCGIAGVVGDTEGAPAGVPRLLRAMLARLQHRGPDRTGWHVFRSGCSLGATRLSIVDLEAGAQPIVSPDGRSAVTFNGAIYGFREIRERLEYPFRTQTDTEVVLALFDLYGPAFLQHLPGMFAIALWDETTRSLLLARDRFGEKPLFYARGHDGSFLFASEVDALLATGLVDRELRREALSHYLKHGFVHPARPIHRGIEALPPAHALRYEGGQARLFRYWEPPEPRAEADPLAAVGEFRRLLGEAVRKQLVADVPVGALLSGGLDSSTVVAEAARLDDGLRTYSMGFGGLQTSELGDAREVAAMHHTRHVEMDVPDVPVADLLVRLQDVYGEPLADSSIVPTYLITQRVHEDCRVALGGDGADELLGGYLPWVRWLLGGGDVSWYPIPEGPDSHRVIQRHYRWRYHFTPEELRQLGAWEETESLIDLSRYSRGTYEDALRYDLETYLPGSVLVKTDRAAMAHGLELRSPFLDVDVASFCLSLPTGMKADASSEKIILRRAYETSWPESVRRKGKLGFGAPMNAWLDRDDVRELKREYLRRPASPLFDHLRFESVQGHVERNDQRTWSLLILALWLGRP